MRFIDMKHANKGFTIIELLVVIAIIGIIASITIFGMGRSREKTRDIVRLTDMRSTVQALELYLNDSKQFPPQDGDGCGGWDVGNSEHPFFNVTGMDKFFNNGKAPVDITATGDCNGYRYYRYAAGDYGCPVNRGAYYVIGITDLETSGHPYPQSPGWSCPGRDWQDEFDWVTGGYEN